MSDLPKVTETELALLDRLWNEGEATIRELTDSLYSEGNDSQYATVQKLLVRLEWKGYLNRDRSQRAHRFRPTVSREDFIGNRLQSLADRLCQGSLTPLLAQLVQRSRLSERERDSLRELIDELEREKSAKEPGRQ